MVLGAACAENAENAALIAEANSTLQHLHSVWGITSMDEALHMLNELDHRATTARQDAAEAACWAQWLASEYVAAAAREAELAEELDDMQMCEPCEGGGRHSSKEVVKRDSEL